MSELHRSAIQSEDFSRKFEWLKRLFIVGVAGLLIFVVGYSTDIDALAIAGLLIFAPFVVFAYVLTFLHWKHRYIGASSTLWGVLLAIETSGWFKIVYLLRHILPDIRGTGRYRRNTAEIKL